MKTSQWRRAVENRCVSSAHLKALSDRSGDRSAGGRRFHVFHVTGPLTAKFHCPVAVRTRTSTVECQSLQIANVQMLTTSDGSSGYTEVAERGWSDTKNTLPDYSKFSPSAVSLTYNLIGLSPQHDEQSWSA